MALRTVDLTELDENGLPGMTAEEWHEELSKPRAERHGLSPMSAEMSMTANGEARLVEAARRHHKARVVEQARAWARGLDSSCL